MKVFDHLHQELSLALDRPVSRFELWISMAGQGAHPLSSLTPEQAARYLETGTSKVLDQGRRTLGAKKWAKLVERVSRFDPESQTPEEIMERLCGTPPPPD